MKGTGNDMITLATVAKRFGTTIERVRAQYLANAAQMRAMAEKAERTGRKVNGYTAEQLNARADEFERIAGGAK
jgi:hypothetical protein